MKENIQYIVKIQFKDDKMLNISLVKEELDRLIKCIEDGKSYWDKDKNSGIFISIYAIKTFQFHEYTKEMQEADAKRKEEAPKEEK